MLQLLWRAVNGRKTYAAAAILAVLAVVGVLADVLSPARATELLAQALALAGLRHAIDKGTLRNMLEHLDRLNEDGKTDA